MNGNGDLPTQYLGDGSVSSPSQGFFYESNTGIYHDLDTYPNTAWTMVKKGNKRIRVDDNLTTILGPVSIPGLTPSTTGAIVTLAVGSVTSPSLNFVGDTKTGLFQDGAGNIGIASNGTESAYLAGTEAIFTNLICNSLTSSGTISCGTNSMTCGPLSSTSVTALSGGTTPVYGFSADLKTGILNPSLGHLQFNVNSVDVMDLTNNVTINTPLLTNNIVASGSIGNGTNSISTGAITSSLGITNQAQILSSFDTKSAPSYSWTGDSKTGVYRSSANVVGVSCGGTTAALFNSTIAVLPSLQSNDITANGTVSCSPNSLTCGPLTCTTLSKTNYSASLSQTLAHSISTSGSFTLATWDNLISNVNFSTITVPVTQVVVPNTGYYRIDTSIDWAASALGVRQIQIEINNGGTPNTGTIYARQTGNALAAGAMWQTTGITVFLNSNDSVSVDVMQSSGGALNTNANGQFSLLRVA